MCTINEVFDMLSSCVEADQKKGMIEASKIKYLSVLIQPIEDKSIWLNCARVLVTKTDDELIPYIVSLFEWLQDMNWPGSDLIYNRLIRIPPKSIELPYSISLKRAQNNRDSAWELSLEDFGKAYKINWCKTGDCSVSSESPLDNGQ